MNYPPKKFKRNGRDQPQIIVPCDGPCGRTGRFLNPETQRLNKCQKCDGTGYRWVTYTRCTTFVDCLEEKTTLTAWKERRVAYGMYLRPDLLKRVGPLFKPEENKGALNSICEEAKDAAEANLKSEYGTDMHTLTELYDAGLSVGATPDVFRADLDAYIEATRDLKHLEIEHPTVHDELKVGGTPDRVFEYEGERYIGDLKTGNIELGILKIAMQLAIYSRAWLYDPDTGERTEHGARTDKGLIFHVPFQTGTAELVWVDLDVGWENVLLAGQVRKARNIKFKHITEPFK